MLFILALLGAFIPVAGASGASWMAVAPSASNPDSLVTPIDLGTNTAGLAVSTPGAAAQLGVAISPDARTAYSVSALSHALVAIDLTTSPPTAGTPVDLTGAPAPPNVRNTQNIAISPDGRKAYVADSANNQVIPVDLTTNPVTPGAPIAVGAGPQGIAFSPDGTMAYVADNGAGTLTPISVATDTAMTAITGVGSQPRELAITPDGSTAYVADNGSSNVTPVALPSGMVGTPISVGTGLRPLGIAITPDGTKAYTANFGPASGNAGPGSTVTPITLATGMAGSPITVGGGPWSIGVTPDGKTVYVGNSNDGTVTPIDVASGIPGSAITGVHSPRSIAITPDQAPIASFTVTGTLPGSVTSFDAAASTVAVGTIVKYVWNFGDGTAVVTTSTPATSHVYAHAGIYSATVTETDSAGTSTTGEVFTGQTASSVGRASAKATRSVVISTAPQPAVSLSAATLRFGSIAVGASSSSQSLRITNTGTAPLSIAGSAISGAQAGDFRLDDDGCSGQTVAPSASCTVDVSFTPGAGGVRSASLGLTGNASGSPYTVALSGSGTTTGVVAGTVEDGTRAGHPPLGGADVRLCQQLTLAGCTGVSTTSSGRYLFTGVKPGAYDLEVFPPSGSGLSNGSRVATAAAGTTDDEVTLLGHDDPLPPGITFSSARGTQQGGHPILYWDDPFSISLPALKPLPAHGTPNTAIDTTIFVTLKSEGSTQTAIGSVLTYRLSYDAQGNAKQGLVLDTALPGTVPGGFSAQLGDTAVSPGSAALVAPAALTAATQALVSSTGLQRLVHGTVRLSILPVRSTSKVTGAAASSTNAVARNASCPPYVSGEALPLMVRESELLGLIEDEKLLIANSKTGAALVEDVNRLSLDLDLLAQVQAEISAVLNKPQPPCPPGPTPTPPPGQVDPCDNIFALSASDCPPGGTLPVDPSGLVRSTTGIPLQHAKVVLERSSAATGPFAPPPNGNAVMSAHNRRNPDFTDIDGHFGWDVFPGFYRVRATSRGCRGAALTRARPVPPPVTNLLLELRCPGLRRIVTHTRILSAIKRGPSFAITMRTLAARARVDGMVTVAAGRHLHAFGFLDRHERVRILLPGAPTSRMRITVRYSGNARFAPSSARARRQPADPG